MATDYWTGGSANWFTWDAWSAGFPVSSSDVVIDAWLGYGRPEVTGSFGTVATIKIADRSAWLAFIDAGASTVAGNVTVGPGALYLDAFWFISGEGGSSLTIGGKLANRGAVRIGASDNALSADSTVQASKLTNSGTIGLYGSSTAQATLEVTSRAGFGTIGTLSGDVRLSGDALVEFANGQIATIAADSALSLIGSHAFVADASHTGSNSALKGLDAVAGELDLENGATAKTSSALTSSGAINLDWSPADGGSLLNVGGALTNSGTIDVGNSSLSARSRLEAASVVNDGAINLFGYADAHAILHVTGAFMNDGSVNLSDDVDRIAGPISGAGNFSLSTGSKLEFGSSVSSGETVTFGDGVDKLVLDSPSLFYGTIDDFFHAGDSVLAKGFDESATTFLYTQTGANSCSWTLTDATHTAVLNFAGEPYSQSDFSIIAAKGTGELVIKFA